MEFESNIQNNREVSWENDTEAWSLWNPLLLKIFTVESTSVDLGQKLSIATRREAFLRNIISAYADMMLNYRPCWTTMNTSSSSHHNMELIVQEFHASIVFDDFHALQRMTWLSRIAPNYFQWNSNWNREGWKSWKEAHVYGCLTSHPSSFWKQRITYTFHKASGSISSEPKNP